MKLKEKIEKEDFKKALKEGNKTLKSVVAELKGAIKNFEIDKGNEPSESQIHNMVRKAVKETKESIDAFKKAKNAIRVEEEEAKLPYFMKYLPQQATPAQLDLMVSKTLDGMEDDMKTMKNMGNIMKGVKDQLKEYALDVDGKSVVDAIQRQVL